MHWRKIGIVQFSACIPFSFWSFFLHSVLIFASLDNCANEYFCRLPMRNHDCNQAIFMLSLQIQWGYSSYFTSSWDFACELLMTKYQICDGLGVLVDHLGLSVRACLRDLLQNLIWCSSSTFSRVCWWNSTRSSNWRLFNLGWGLRKFVEAG